MKKISAVIITYNEEDKIENCLRSLFWVDEIVVVDSGSTDRTVEIAREFTEKIYANKFIDFSAQKNFALAKTQNEWVLFVDADEIVPEELHKTIQRELTSSDIQDAYYIKRQTYIFGRLMKKGGHDKDYQMRLFRKECADFSQPVHEKVVLDTSKIGTIEDTLIHYSTANIDEYLEKLSLYSDLEAKFIASKGKNVGFFDIVVKPVLRFIQKYIVQQGFRDGFEGLIFYFLYAFSDFVKYVKCREMELKSKKTADRIKILYVDDVADFGGGEQHLLSLIGSLDQAKYDVSVACRKETIIAEKISNMGLSVENIRFGSKFDIGGLFKFYKIVRANHYDIVHLQDNRSHWIGGIAAKLAGAPFVVATVHMVNVHRRVDPGSFAKFVLKVADRVWAWCVDFIIVVSDFNKQALVEQGIKPEKVQVIYNAVGPDYFEEAVKGREFKDGLGIEDNEIVIGTISRLSDQKGLHYLLESSKEILENHDNIKVLLVGDGPLKDDLFEQARQLDLHGKISFLGHKENVKDYISLFDIFVLPSVYEGLPIAIIEAMAGGKPIIATDVGGVSELVRNDENGYLIPSKDVEELTSALRKLIDDKDLRSRMGRESYRLARENFMTKKMASKTDKIYDRFLKGGIK